MRVQYVQFPQKKLAMSTYSIGIACVLSFRRADTAAKVAAAAAQAKAAETTAREAECTTDATLSAFTAHHQLRRKATVFNIWFTTDPPLLVVQRKRYRSLPKL